MSINSSLPDRIPTVTEADLLTFHERAFGHHFAGQSSISDRLEQSTGENHQTWDEVYEEEEDASLGYYPDGVKRTLTDEQIAMFRHTEIQTLLRERRLARELAAVESAEGEEDLDVPGTRHAASQNQPSGNGFKAGGTRNEETKLSGPEIDDKVEIENDEEEEEYARFLRAEREEFQRAAAAKRNGERMTYYDPDDRTISTRRRVREMDAVQTSTDTLTYDDEGSSTATEMKPMAIAEVAKEMTADISISRTGIHVQPEKTQGRKIWWPEIRLVS